MNEVMMISTTIIAVGGAVGIVWSLLRPLARKTRALMDALDLFTTDWFGEKARPGHKAVPGVMDRLQTLENELTHNGGTSMKDALKRVEDKINQIDVRLEDGNKRFDEIEKRVK
jgi:hypothetical protein